VWSYPQGWALEPPSVYSYLVDYLLLVKMQAKDLVSYYAAHAYRTLTPRSFT